MNNYQMMAFVASVKFWCKLALYVAVFGACVRYIFGG